RAPRSAVARGAARSLPRLGERGDAPADARRGGGALLPALPRAVPNAARARGGEARRRARALGTPRVLRAGTEPPSRGAGGRGGACNEALMEPGAALCTPRAPRCGECPIAAHCAGRGAPERYPEARKRGRRTLLEWRALALTRRDGAVILVRRPERSLFGGL